MRNVKSAILPSGGSLLIKVSPPIHQSERPMVMTLWKQGMTVKVLTPELVHVINTTPRLMPMLFYVGVADDRWLETIRQLLQEKT